jgi:hypothetical protein
MHGDVRTKRIANAGSQTIGYFEPPLELAQNQPAAVEARDNSFPGDR